MSASTTETIAALSVLMGARYPQFTQQGTSISAANGPPASVTAGVALEDSIYAMVVVELKDSASAVTARLWGLPKNFSTWCVLNSASLLEIDANWMERIIVAGVDRLYIEVLSIDTDSVDVFIGPCIDETMV